MGAGNGAGPAVAPTAGPARATASGRRVRQRRMPAPDGPFSIAVRVYGPEPSVLDGGRAMPKLAVRDH
ncbi:hypothetical protein OG912_25005 [Streptomyces sp. NBC_00464]|uniref:hypothetical protein n=1 Tax=Streptomyces sp. NBC_00464 TaxID=2975751 RepID=UPI002E182D0C